MQYAIGFLGGAVVAATAPTWFTQVTVGVAILYIVGKVVLNISTVAAWDY